jgi:hypothetical protein
MSQPTLGFSALEHLERVFDVPLYESDTFTPACRPCGVEMDLDIDGFWVCPECGREVHFEET